MVFIHLIMSLFSSLVSSHCCFYENKFMFSYLTILIIIIITLDEKFNLTSVNFHGNNFRLPLGFSFLQMKLVCFGTFFYLFFFSMFHDLMVSFSFPDILLETYRKRHEKKRQLSWTSWVFFSWLLINWTSNISESFWTFGKCITLFTVHFRWWWTFWTLSVQWSPDIIEQVISWWSTW